MDRRAGRRPVEGLLPPPENPLPLPVAHKPAPAAKPPLTAPKLAVPNSPPPPPAITAPAKLPPAPKTAAKPASKPASGKGYRVQVASLRGADAAMRAWTKRVKQSGGVLAGLTLFVKRAMIPKKGTYFRVQTGPLLDKVAARRVCESLKRRKIGCLVVKP